MTCLDCGDEIFLGEPHHCPNRPMMLKITWSMLQKIGRWLNGQESKIETEEENGPSGDGREENQEEGKVSP